MSVNKLPQITFSFWVMKICATTLGETGGDLLSMTLNLGYALSSSILIAFFLTTLLTQLYSKKYHPLLYWGVILSTSTAGTTISDYMDRTLKLGYPLGSLILILLLICIFIFWRVKFGSMSVNHIQSRPVELTYWVAILFSNTLGTALGDFLADSSGLGFAGGAMLIASLLIAILLCYKLTNISKVLLFWLAFVLTRPFGATVGDLISKPNVAGGLGLGTIGSSLILAAVLAIFIVYTSYSHYSKASKTILLTEEAIEVAEHP